ncbi:MAG: hypothetical protein QXX68_02160 [Candidatus Pacearchaeota archaeon]
MEKYLFSAILLAIGIIFLYLAIKKQKKRKKTFYIKEKDPFLIEGKTTEELLKSFNSAIKYAIKKHYKISEKLSLREIIVELEKKENPFFLDIAKSLEKFYYQQNTLSKQEIIKLKNKFLEELKEKEEIERKENEKKKENMTFIEKILEKEKELKEKTKIEKIRLKKLKNS